LKAKTKSSVLKELNEALAHIQEMQGILDIWRKRVDHADIEATQARLSRDGYKEKMTMLLTRMKEQGISIVIASAHTEGQSK
jgi:uncharacterized protein (UPF0210 family)